MNEQEQQEAIAQFKLSRYSAEAIRHGVALAIAGERPHDEGTTLEERVFALVRAVEATAFGNGRLSVQREVRKALGVL